jgi:hypothetical protein
MHLDAIDVQTYHQTTDLSLIKNQMWMLKKIFFDGGFF